MDRIVITSGEFSSRDLRKAINSLQSAIDTLNEAEIDKLSRQVAEERRDKLQVEQLKSMSKVSLEDLRETPLSLPASGGCQEFLAFLSLHLHPRGFASIFTWASSLCVSVFLLFL